MSKRQLRTFTIQVQWTDGTSETFRRRATHSLDAFRQWREGLTYDDGIQVARFTVSEGKSETKTQEPNQ